MTIEIVVLASIFILCLINGILAIALKRSDSKNVINSQNVKISVIIAAKNEENNIDRLIYSLINLKYQRDNYELIIVDDNSTDNTLTKLKNLTSDLKYFAIKELKPIGLKGKREALAFGIQQAKNSFIVITDADCQPQPNWLREYSGKFQYGYDMLLGIAPFYQDKNLVNQISCFENLRSSLLAISFTILGMPYTASARNFGFSKNAFDKIGGYSRTRDTLSGDDDLLLREAVRNNLKIGVVTEPGSYVFSETKKTFSEYFRQKARHTQTSFHYLLKHKVVLAVWHLLNLSSLLSPILMFINPLLGILLPSKIFIDLILIKSIQKKFSYKLSVVQIVYLQIFYEIFLIVHFFNSKFSRIEWK